MAPLPPRLPNERSPCRDLSGEVTKTEPHYFAYGGFSEVYRGEWNDIRVAIKVLRGIHTDPDVLEVTTRRLNRETYIWHRLSHPNILAFFGVCYDIAASPALISPLCDFGNVVNYLKEHPEVNRLSIARGVALGLEYLHSIEIVHGDIKPHNVLIDDKGVARLCDFGRSRIIDHRGFTTAFSGTARWMAPELLAVSVNDDEDIDVDELPPPVLPSLTTKTDTFGFAMVVLEIMTGKPPFHYINNDSVVIYKIQTGGRPLPEKYGLPDPNMWAILKDCWDQRPESRPDMNVVVERFSRL